MELKEYQNEAIEGLIDNEEALSELYKIYSEKFPDDKEFWLGLSQDETVHANWIRNLRDRTKKGSAFFNEDRFRLEAIKTFLGEVNKQISEAKFKKLLPINALSTAYYLESSLIERKCLEVFEGDSVELKHLLKNLAEATKKHSEKVSEQLNKLRNKE
ncbi:MAG: hypothetical protein ACKKMP_03540 [Candidatus Nealsonbacteria bacterium]